MEDAGWITVAITATVTILSGVGIAIKLAVAAVWNRLCGADGWLTERHQKKMAELEAQAAFIHATASRAASQDEAIERFQEQMAACLDGIATVRDLSSTSATNSKQVLESVHRIEHAMKAMDETKQLCQQVRDRLVHQIETAETLGPENGEA